MSAANSDGYLVQRYADRLGSVKVGAAALTFTAIDRLHLEEFHAMRQRARELAPDANGRTRSATVPVSGTRRGKSNAPASPRARSWPRNRTAWKPPAAYRYRALPARGSATEGP